MTVYITGDKHGEIEMYQFYKKRLRNHITPVHGDKIIIAGDFGLIWSREPSRKEKHFINYLNNAKWDTLFVDGNHENYEMLAELPEESRWDGVVGKVSDKIFHLKRGNIYTIDGHKILAFGGAQSHDKLTRNVGIDWWHEEIPSWNELEYCLTNIEKHNNEVDFVITHTCPIEVQDWIKATYGMKSEREGDPTCKMLSHIASVLNFKAWYFGHWHNNFTFGKYHCLWHTYKELQ